MSDSESSGLSNYESENESENEQNQIDECFRNFFYKGKDFSYSNLDYENPLNLISDIITLREALENNIQDWEALHVLEDTLLRTFVYHISEGTYDTDTIKKISTLFIGIPDYCKWYA